MRKLILLSLLALLCSCRTTMISDDLIIIHSKHKIAKPHYYKYFYKCYQNGLKLRVYSNSEYKEGEPLIVKGI